MIWQLEWRIALAARRLFLFNTLVPLLLVAPIAWSAAPRAHAAMVFTLLVAFFGTFGSAIPLVRDAESGLFGRVLLAGVPATRLLPQRVAANAALDALQLLPTLLVIAAAGGALRALPLFVVVTGCALLVANCVGAWIAGAARSIAEGALLAAVATLFLLHGSGVFRTPAPGSIAAELKHVLPYGFLHDTMRGVIGAAALPPAWTSVAGSALGAAAAVLLTIALSGALSRALLRVSRQ